MRASRIDANHKEIIACAKKLGGTVLSLVPLREGADFIWGVKGMNFIIEVKDGKKPKSQKELTTNEKKFHENWNGQVTIIESIDALLNFYRKIGEQQND